MYSAFVDAAFRTLTGTQPPPARYAAKIHTTAPGSFGEYTARESPTVNPAANKPWAMAIVDAFAAE